MARLYTSGAETNDITAEGLSQDGTLSTMTMDTTSVRSGVYVYKVDTGAGGSIGNWRVGWSGTTDATYFARFYYFQEAAPAFSCHVAAIKTSGGSAKLSVRTDGTGKIGLFNDVAGTQIGSYSSVLTNSTWYRVELEFNVASAGGTASTAKMLIDGTQIAATTTANLSNTAPARFYWGFSSGTPGANKILRYDDIALNDTAAGSGQTSYPGNGKVVNLFPISDNARTGWTTGNGGTTSLYDALNNKPPTGVIDSSGTATSQIKDGNNNATDTYDANMTTYSTAGIDSDDVVNVIHMLAMGSTSSLTSTNTNAISVQSNPAIAEASYSIDVTTAGTYPTGWHRSGLLGTTHSPSVTVGTSAVMRTRKEVASTRVHSVCLMTLVVDYTPVTLGTTSVGTATGSGLSATGTAGAAASATASVGTATASGLSATGTAGTGVVNATGTASVGTGTASGLSATGRANTTVTASIGGATGSGLSATGSAGTAATGTASIGTATGSGLTATGTAGQRATGTASVGSGTASGTTATANTSTSDRRALVSWVSFEVPAVPVTATTSVGSATASGLAATGTANSRVTPIVGTATGDGLDAIGTAGTQASGTAVIGAATASGLPVTATTNSLVLVAAGLATGSGTAVTATAGAMVSTTAEGGDALAEGIAATGSADFYAITTSATATADGSAALGLGTVVGDAVGGAFVGTATASGTTATATANSRTTPTVGTATASGLTVVGGAGFTATTTVGTATASGLTVIGFGNIGNRRRPPHRAAWDAVGEPHAEWDDPDDLSLGPWEKTA